MAPEILPYEIGNALSAMAKRKRLTDDQVLDAQRSTRRIAVRLVNVDIQRALEIALAHRIYAYDAYFLCCAQQLSIPLLTLDRQMQWVAN